MDIIDGLTPIGPFGDPIPIYPPPPPRPKRNSPNNTHPPPCCDPRHDKDNYELGSVPKEKELDTLQKQCLLFFLAGITAAFTSSLYNGLDCLRVRWQVLNPASTPASAATMTANATSTDLMQFATRIVQTEGFVNGLWRPGIVANGIGMGLSGALRFGCYEIVRDALHHASPQGREQHHHHACDHDGTDVSTNKNGFKMALAGLSCGALAYFITTPFHLLKTMIQAERGLIGPNGLYLDGPRAGQKPYVTGLVSGMKTIVKDHGILGLWRGCIPLTARGATFTGGQLVGYDGFKTTCKSHGWLEDGPLLHALAGVVAAASATVTATPADYTMSRYMASKETSVGVVVRRIYKEGGMAGFWRGSLINFCRSTPVFLTYTAVYEQLRRSFGLGYFG